MIGSEYGVLTKVCGDILYPAQALIGAASTKCVDVCKLNQFSHQGRNDFMRLQPFKGQKLVVVGDRKMAVFVGPSAVLTNVYNPRAFIERKQEFKATLVKKGATIGANATIISPVTTGRYAFTGAGAVVKRDVPDYGLVVGVPARQIGWVCKCGTTLDFKDNHAICSYCGSECSLEGDRFIMIKEEAD